MIVVKKNKTKLKKVEYPAIWGNLVQGLDSDISFYEIQTTPYPPEYDANKHDAIEVLTITETQGDFLKICLIEWNLQEKSQSTIINNLEKTFGDFIDSNYPIWKRVKDIVKITTKGEARKAQESNLRDELQQRIDNYINSGVFPSFIFIWVI